MMSEEQLIEDTSKVSESKPSNGGKKSKKKFFIVVMLTLIFIGIISFFVIKHYSENKTLPYPISKNTKGLLGYDIYYPNQKLLPPGYILNMKSFSDNSQAIIYNINQGNSKIVFSDQAKPTTDQLSQFIAKNMPLHTTFNTPVGTATIGALNNQTVVSLPTKTNAWLIITAPGNTNQDNLKIILKSIELAQ